MKTLIVGITGTVGEAVARALVAEKRDVRALVRKPRTFAGVETAVGSLDDRASLERALDGIDRLFFVTPHDKNEAQLGAQLVDVAEAAGVKRIVFCAAYGPAVWNPVAMWLTHALVGLVGPHYRGKLAVARRVRRTANPVILMPSNFYQNDDLALATIRDGLYPQAIGDKGVNRVDVEDIALAARLALTTDLPAGAYPLVGPRSYTQAECAAIWSEALGRTVVPGGDWKTATGVEGTKATDFEKTFKILQRFGVPTKAHEVEATTKLLGRPPRRYEDYVQATVSPERSDGLDTASTARH